MYGVGRNLPSTPLAFPEKKYDKARTEGAGGAALYTAVASSALSDSPVGINEEASGSAGDGGISPLER